LNSSIHLKLIVSLLEVIRMIWRMWAIIQFTLRRTAIRKFSPTTNVTMLGTRHKTVNHQSIRGKHQRQMACHFPILMPFGEFIQFIQQRTVPLKFSLIISVITHGTLSSIKIRRRNRGKSLRRVACHWRALMPSTPWKRPQFTQLKIANQKFFHTTREIMHGTMSNIITPLRNHGKHRHQLACHWLALMLSMLDRSIQLRIVNPRSSHITREITLGTMNSITTLPRNRGRNQLLMACH
jgi:hypothetical protein